MAARFIASKQWHCHLVDELNVQPSGQKNVCAFHIHSVTSWPGYIYWEDVDTVTKMALIKAKRDPVIVKRKPI